MEELLGKCFRCKNSDVNLQSQGTDIVSNFICKKNNVPIKDIKGREDCKDFRSRFIEYPIAVSDIKIDSFTEQGLYSKRVGEIVKIKPCGKEYNGKTFIGILLGEFPISPFLSHNTETNVLTISPFFIPAIFVPELKKIVYGNESWWSTLSKNDDVSNLDISDKDIQNTWYMKLLKDNNEVE